MDSHDAAERIDALLHLEDHRRALTTDNQRLRRELHEAQGAAFTTALLALLYGAAIGVALTLAATHWAAPILDWITR